MLFKNNVKYLIMYDFEVDTVVLKEIIMKKMYFMRRCKVVLDSDLAELYGVDPKVLKQAVKRNISRFPVDFMFELTKEENEVLRAQFVGIKRDQSSKNLPLAFTEQGVAMLSTILSTESAIKVNIQIVRIFIRMHEILSDNLRAKLEIEEMKNQLSDRVKTLNWVSDISAN